MRGRKPTPTSLKLVQGNPGHRPINKDEPRPELVAPTPPKHLYGEGLKEWRRITPKLLKLGLLSEIDRAALSMYCTQWARHVLAEDHIRRMSELLHSAEGGLVETTTQGYRMQSAWLQISNRAQEYCFKFLAPFGMTPSDRSRISTTPQLSLPGLEGDTDADKKWAGL